MFVKPQVLADFFDRGGIGHRFIVLRFESRKSGTREAASQDMRKTRNYAVARTTAPPA